MKHNPNHDDEEDQPDRAEPHELLVYNLDPHTQDLIEIACNCLITLSEAQLSDESSEALRVIADTLAERFNISRLAQELHTTEDGEQEIIFKPDTSLFPEDPEVPDPAAS